MKVIFQNTSLTFKSVQKTIVTVNFDGTAGKIYETNFDFVAGKTYSIKWVYIENPDGNSISKNVFVLGHTSPLCTPTALGAAVTFNPQDSGKMAVFAANTHLSLGECRFEVIDITPE